MAEAAFTSLSDDVVLKIFFHLEDDPRNWARLSCVCRKFSSLISGVCCKSKCLSSFPALSSAVLSPSSPAAFPGGWAALHKLAVCCPGLLHSGVLLDNSDFGLHRELVTDNDEDHHFIPLTPPPSTTTSSASVGAAVKEEEEEESYGGWSLYDDLYFDTVYNAGESEPRNDGVLNPAEVVGNDAFAPSPTPMQTEESDSVPNDGVLNPAEGARTDDFAPGPMTSMKTEEYEPVPIDGVLNPAEGARNDDFAPGSNCMQKEEERRNDDITPVMTYVDVATSTEEKGAALDQNKKSDLVGNDCFAPGLASMQTEGSEPAQNGRHPNRPDPVPNDHLAPGPMTSAEMVTAIHSGRSGPVQNGMPARNDDSTPAPTSMQAEESSPAQNRPIHNINNPSERNVSNDYSAPAPTPVDIVTSIQAGVALVHNTNHTPNDHTIESDSAHKRRKLMASPSPGRKERAHLAGGGWSLSREQGNKLLASRFRGDVLYLCDWPGCVHIQEKRNYMLFRGFFGNFKRSGVWRAINDAHRGRVEVKCAFCECRETWDLHAAFCLRRGFGFHDDGEPVVRAYVCENGHVSGAWTDLPIYS